MKFLRHVVAAVACVYLAGCASGAQVANMVNKGEQQQFPQEIQENLALSSVTGGEETNPAWTSEISDKAFSEAIKQSLVEQGLFSDDGNYQLAVEMVEIEQPLFGLDMTVTTTVKYTLTDKETGKVLFDETVNAPYTATVGDAFAGVKRLQLANEGSGRENIKGLLELLSKLDINADQISMVK
ncbi:hypothetical protein SNR37_002672 [Agarivorans aestuarii]|uniref:Lipoprotein n=1 Tax=Agarivorans aestuarii TaxID=1563703 RepID=A0ABU7G1H7_9ALTE|nr:hypothetical protein [Agarivorans aestuarii]MEE1673258.1 hypothetical protein [Agarivorans aestuarii]